MVSDVVLRLEDLDTIRTLKERFAPDGGADREHNATAESLGFGAIHYAMVTNLRPKRALVIGSRYGFVPIVIALALRVNGFGELDFVDANYDDSVHGFETAYGGVAHWSDQTAAHFSRVAGETAVHVHITRSSEFFNACSARYGYIYLDGDHSYEGCREDFENAVRFAEPGAMIVLHDVVVTSREFGVGRLFSELDPEHFDKILIGAWPGLGLVQAKAA